MLKPKIQFSNSTTETTLNETERQPPETSKSTKRKIRSFDTNDDNKTKDEMVDQLKRYMRELELQNEENQKAQDLTNVYKTLLQLDSEDKELDTLEQKLYENKKRKKQLKIQLQANEKNKDFLVLHRFAFRKVAGILGLESFNKFYVIDPITRIFRISFIYDTACREANNLIHRYEPNIRDQVLAKIDEYYHLIAMFFLQNNMNNYLQKNSNHLNTATEESKFQKEQQKHSVKFHLNRFEREKEKYLFRILLQINNNDESKAIKLIAGQGCGRC